MTPPHHLDITDIPSLLHEVVVHFRLGMQAAAAEGLIKLIDQLLTLLQSASLPPIQVTQLSAVLGDVVAAQQRHDTLYLADLLQYRLAPLIPRG